MVYVQSKDGQPLMPTKDHRMVRLLLKADKAKVVRRTPFTIRLNITTNTYTQPVTLGIDAGSKHVGMSATTEERELYASETELRDDVVAKLSDRRQYRRSRRNHKTRYRKPRFNNRTHSKHKGWLAPSVEQKISSHLRLIHNVCKILPVSEIVIEVASFDMQKIKNTRITHGFKKSHMTDARCISGHPDAVPVDECFYQKCVRRHNRQLYKANTCKDGIRKANQAPKYVYGYQLFDKVSYKGQECFIWGRRRSGYFMLKTLNGTIITGGVSYRKLALLERAGTILCERRGVPPTTKVASVRA